MFVLRLLCTDDKVRSKVVLTKDGGYSDLISKSRDWNICKQALVKYISYSNNSAYSWKWVNLNITDELELAGVGCRTGPPSYCTYICWLSLRHFYKPDCQSQKANNAGRKPPEKIQDILASTMSLIIDFFYQNKTQFVRFWGQTRIIILSLPSSFLWLLKGHI
jgi:hypothetical protein